MWTQPLSIQWLGVKFLSRSYKCEVKKLDKKLKSGADKL